MRIRNAQGIFIAIEGSKETPAGQKEQTEKELQNRVSDVELALADLFTLGGF
jgi:hypothetical protein